MELLLLLLPMLAGLGQQQQQMQQTQPNGYFSVNKKNPTHRLLFFLNLLVLLLPFAPASSSSPCLSIYVCVSLSFLLGPSKLIMGSGGSEV
jgi:hypothetical protein